MNPLLRQLAAGTCFLLATGCPPGSVAGGNGTSSGTSSGSTTGTATSGKSTGSSSSGGTYTPSDGGIYGLQTTPEQTADLADGGAEGTGVLNLPDGGGITLGPAYNFSSSFAYLSNSAQAAGASFVSRVDTVTGQEVGRYPSVLPLDNQGKSLCTTPNTGSSCLVDLDTTYYDNAPSRTVVDLNGGVFVANRGNCNWQVCTADQGTRSYDPNNPDNGSATPAGAMIGAVQGSVSYIVNRVDHPEQCAPRCQNRQGWNLPDGGAAIFSSGITIPGVGSIPASEVLMPSPAGGSVTTLSQFSPDVVNHPCLDNGAHNPTDVTDPTNYDDCTRFTIPLGNPNGYDLTTQSRYADRFAPRGIAISKNCGTLAGQPACDLYVGLTEPGAENSQFIHLGYTNNFDVVNTIDSTVGVYGAYGAAIDCDGLLWYGHGAQAGAIDTSTDQVATTWSFNDGGGAVQMTTVRDLATANLCEMYGVAVDTQQHLWTGLIIDNGAAVAGACAFDYGTFFNTAALHNGSLDYGTASNIITSLFHRFPVGNSAAAPLETAGIVADAQGTAYFTIGAGPGVGAAAVNFAGGGSACGVSGDSNCLWVANSTANSPTTGTFPSTLGDSWGIDLDQDGNPILAAYTPGGVLGLNAQTGVPLAIYAWDGGYGLPVSGPAGAANLYTYSDFTGYAFRHITQPEGLYEQVIQGCSPPNSMTWHALDYGAVVPSGSDIAFQVDTANDPAAFTNASTTGPQIQGTWTCSSASTCPSPAAVTGLGNTVYARVTAKLQGPHCSDSGGPVLKWVAMTYDCEPPGVNH